MTPDEYVAARELAATENTTVSELLRRAIPTSGVTRGDAGVGGVRRMA